jgi:hypothetical protein
LKGEDEKVKGKRLKVKGERSKVKGERSKAKGQRWKVEVGKIGGGRWEGQKIGENAKVGTVVVPKRM